MAAAKAEVEEADDDAALFDEGKVRRTTLQIHL
jgi:hypothetical protein